MNTDEFTFILFVQFDDSPGFLVTKIIPSANKQSVLVEISPATVSRLVNHVYLNMFCKEIHGNMYANPFIVFYRTYHGRGRQIHISFPVTEEFFLDRIKTVKRLIVNDFLSKVWDE